MGASTKKSERIAIAVKRAPGVLTDNTLTMKEKAKKLGISAPTVRMIANKLNIKIKYKPYRLKDESICWDCTKSSVWNDCIWPGKPVPGAKIEYEKRIYNGAVEIIGKVKKCPRFVNENKLLH